MTEESRVRQSEDEKMRNENGWALLCQRRTWRLNIVISATFDLEWALGGPQVQLSQAERHLMEECNPSLQRWTSERMSNRKTQRRQGEPNTAKEVYMVKRQQNSLTFILGLSVKQCKKTFYWSQSEYKQRLMSTVSIHFPSRSLWNDASVKLKWDFMNLS